MCELYWCVGIKRKSDQENGIHLCSSVKSVREEIAHRWHRFSQK